MRWIKLSVCVAVLLFISQLIMSSITVPTSFVQPTNEVMLSNHTFGTLLDIRIQLRYIDQFLTDEQCNYLITVVQNRMIRSPLMLADGTISVNSNRSSSSAYLDKSETEEIIAVEQQAIALWNGSIHNLEPLQVVRYGTGEQIKPHFDWFNYNTVKKVGYQRQYTLFVYLNDVVHGGGTQFVRLNQTVQPRKGAALFWHNCANKDEPHLESLHAGLPPIGDNAIKYGVNIFYAFDPINSNVYK